MNNKNGILLEVTDGINDSYGQWENGKLEIKKNLFYSTGNDEKEIFRLKGLYNYYQENKWSGYFNITNNETGNMQTDFETGSFIPLQKLTGNLSDYPSAWFQRVNFKGAFGEDNWIDGLTLLSQRL